MKTNWLDLSARGRPIDLAVDTEFEGLQTLTIQFAVLLGDQIRLQIYAASDLPDARRTWFGKKFAERFAPLSVKIETLPTKPIRSSLSPARVVADLFRLNESVYWSRQEGLSVLAKCGESDHRAGVEIRLIGHCLRADLLRAFGSRFWGDLLFTRDVLGRRLRVRDSKVLAIAADGAEAFGPPVVEFVSFNGQALPIRLSTLDTAVAYGPGSLDRHARQFLGIGKVGDFTEQKKKKMRSVFRSEPERAYTYAAADVVLTLLVAERMASVHEEIYARVGGELGEVPRCHSTPGLRVANLLLRDAVRCSRSDDPRECSTRRGGRPPSLRALKSLFRDGSAAALAEPGVSRFAPQIGQTHGGLLFSRTPTGFFHDAEGQFRDVDLSSCYPAILRAMNVYVGRPIVLEPGSRPMTLGEACELMEKEAITWDGWFLKVTGSVSLAPNALIPSTTGALTHENVERRAARSRAGEQERGYTSLFTREISAGVVAWPTWMMIRALPAKVRREYEQLQVDSVVFYPKSYIAESWDSLQRLREKLTTGSAVSWHQTLDLRRKTKTTVEELDGRYACLR